MRSKSKFIRVFDKVASQSEQQKPIPELMIINVGRFFLHSFSTQFLAAVSFFKYASCSDFILFK